MNQKYPLKIDYQIAFLKTLLRELEQRNVEEVHDVIYEQLTLKLDVEKTDFSYKHVILQDNQVVTVKESNSFIRDGTTGLVLWPAAIALTEFILQYADDFRDKSILELGSGASGFVGISLARHCRPRKVFMSDCHESVIKTLVENVGMNFEDVDIMDDGTVNIIHKMKTKEQVELGVLNLSWEDVDNCVEDLKFIEPDVLLAADVVYDETIFDALIGCLTAIFKVFNNVQFYLSQTIRNDETFNKFCKLLKQKGFSMERLSFQHKFLEHLISDNSGKIEVVKISQG